MIHMSVRKILARHGRVNENFGPGFLLALLLSGACVLARQSQREHGEEEALAANAKAS